VAEIIKSLFDSSFSALGLCLMISLRINIKIVYENFKNLLTSELLDYKDNQFLNSVTDLLA